MSYLRFSGGIVTYPYSLSQLRRDRPNVSFPSEMGPALLLEFDVFEVTPTARPAPSDAITKNVVEVEPIPVGGVWTQRWVEVDASAEQTAARQTEATETTQRADIKAMQRVQNFIALSPAQVRTFVNNNTADLAAMRMVLGDMAVMLLLLARREFR